MAKKRFLDDLSLFWSLVPKKDSFVVIPLLSMIINAVLASLLSQITKDDDPVLLEQGRQMGSRISGASISIVTLTFSLTVLSVQIASQTYSPRLLDDFLKDPVSKMVISVNLGAFVYCYTMLYFFDFIEPDGPVPYVAIHVISVHCGIVLLAFINFIHVFINGFRIETILKRAADSSLTAARALSSLNTEDLERDELPDVPNNAIKVKADESGYITNFYFTGLLQEAEDLDICLRYMHQIGDYVNRGTILAMVWDAKTRNEDSDAELGKRVMKSIDLSTVKSEEEDDARPFEKKVEKRLGELVSRGVQFAKKRSSDLDVTLGILQLSDIAVRALSPGINDPQTAVQCMDVLSSLLATLAQMNLGLPNARDENGHVRICAPRRSFPYLLSMIDAIRRYGASDLSVCRRGLRLFGDLGVIATNMNRLDHLPTILAQLDQWLYVSKQNFEHSPELKSLVDLHAHVQRLIAQSENVVLEEEDDGVKDLQEFETTYNEEAEGDDMGQSERNRNMVSDFLKKFAK